MCDSCNPNNNYENDELNLCKECSKKESNKMITKTDAIKLFALTDDDLENVRHKKYKNMYRNYSYLYLRSDIKQIAINKYGSEEKFNEMINKKRSRTIKKENFKAENRNRLEAYLKKIGLPGIRNDSFICDSYIEKGEESGFTVEKIGAIMEEMKFFYEKTTYNSLLRTYRENKRDYWILWKENNEEKIRKDAKRNALLKYTEVNYNNTHKMFDEVPFSLHNELNNCINEIEKSKVKRELLDVIKKNEEIIKKSKEQIKLTNKKYKDLCAN